MTYMNVSRRTLLKATGLGTAALALPNLLAACSGDGAGGSPSGDFTGALRSPWVATSSPSTRRSRATSPP